MNVAEAPTDVSMDDLGIQQSEDGNQYLTFIMAGEEYGVDILSVQEIRGWDSATSIPNAPDYVKGVINLRGTIVPLIDLRRRFGLEATELTAITVVIVLGIETNNGSRVMGIVVDAVSDVYTIANADMKPPPDLGDSVNTSYIRGISNVDEKMVVLLDINKLLTTDELPDLEMVTQQMSAQLSAESKE